MKTCLVINVAKENLALLLQATQATSCKVSKLTVVSNAVTSCKLEFDQRFSLCL